MITVFWKWFLSTLDDRMEKFRGRVRSSTGYEEWESDSSLVKTSSSWCHDKVVKYVDMDGDRLSLTMSVIDVSVNAGA